MAFKKTFIISDESVNSQGFKVITNGIQLDNARLNCPCFYDHKTWEVPLGHWENLRVENNKLVADLIINGDNDREKMYIKKIENNDIKGCSIGADALTWNEDPLQLSQGQTRPTLEKSELFEISITPLPGNQSALALKFDGSLIKLTADNSNKIPLLKPEQNMKQIALKLGLTESATEQEMIQAVAKLKRQATNAVAMHKVIEEEIASTLPEGKKAFFVSLSKTDVGAAMEFLKLNKVEAGNDLTPALSGGEGETPTPTQKLAKVVKDVTVTQLIQQNRKPGAVAAKEGEDSYDYLQKKNPVELARIHKEEPDEYARLAKDYEKGVRYNG